MSDTKTELKVTLETIPSRLTRFWYELVLCVNDGVIKSYGQFRTREESDEHKVTYKLTTDEQ